MPFKVTARTILQLGAELISSDAIAFYELIKNAYDAGSPNIFIRVCLHFSSTDYTAFLEELHIASKKTIEKQKRFNLEEFKKKVTEQIQYISNNTSAILNSISSASSIAQLISLIEQANYIEFDDVGTGMSFKDLGDVYLTIGTRSRRIQKQHQLNSRNADEKPILGEKGLGRLSVMRLGEGLQVTTATKTDKHYNELFIDWRLFSHDSSELINDILIEPTRGAAKKNISWSGTNIKIFTLKESWNLDKANEIAREELSKFIDPFSKKGSFSIRLIYNNEQVRIPDIEKILFENAHAYVEAKFQISESGELILSGRINYYLYNKEKTFRLTTIDLLPIASQQTLESLGPFAMKFYWYNGRIIQAMDGIGNVVAVRKYIHRWANGLMVFRDGFRVYPYGGPDDDWLSLDKKALGAQGYKVNRRQIIGKVDISSVNNPALLDQTNREGLRDCPEKTALIALLQHIMWKQFKVFLNDVEDDRTTNAPLDLETIEDRLEQNELKLEENLQFLTSKYPVIKSEKVTLQNIRETFGRTKRLLSETKSVFESYESRRDETVHLASLGLMVDIVAHELNRSTENAIKTLNTFNKKELTERTNSLLDILRLQLKTLQTRLKVLDPLGPTGRNRKEQFDVKRLFEEALVSHEEQFKRHGIRANVESNIQGPWKINGVKGLFLQLFENCIANSVYWLDVEKKLHSQFKGTVTVFLDKSTSCIYFYDNGPGIPLDRKEDIFKPFFSTKPPDEGKGLGLYLSKEIAKYHDVSFDLSNRFQIHNNRLNTFQLDISSLL